MSVCAQRNDTSGELTLAHVQRERDTLTSQLQALLNASVEQEELNLVPSCSMEQRDPTEELGLSDSLNAPQWSDETSDLLQYQLEDLNEEVPQTSLGLTVSDTSVEALQEALTQLRAINKELDRRFHSMTEKVQQVSRGAIANLTSRVTEFGTKIDALAQRVQQTGLDLAALRSENRAPVDAVSLHDGDVLSARDIRVQNLTVARAISRMVRRSLDPEAVGDVIITNDGGTILNQLEVLL